MLHNRQAPGRDFHKHFSLAPARSDTITASSKTSSTAATRNPPPHPDPYKTGPKLAKRRRGHHTCNSSLSLPPPPHPACALLPPRPTPSLSPSLHKGARGAQAGVVVGGKADLTSNHNATYPSPSGPSTSSRRRLERHTRGREGYRRVSSQETRDTPRLNQQRHPPRPSGPADTQGGERGTGRCRRGR